MRDLNTHILKPNLRHYLCVLFTFVFTLGYTQLIFEQDIVQGGVTGAGFSTGQGSGSGVFEIYIEPGSIIKKAYMFTYRIGYPPEVSFVLNSTSHVFDSTNILMKVNHSNPFASPISMYYKDLTADIDPTITTFNITIPDQFGLPINWGYWTVYLIVVYENLTLNQIAYSLVINDKDFLGNEMYSLSNLNPVDVSNSVGFSLYTDRSGLSHLPPTKEVFVNSDLLGVIGGSDSANNSWGSAGVKGHFYYQNNELFGLDDDIANNVMSGTDGIANISTLLSNNTTSVDFQVKHINYPNQANNHSNMNLAYFLTYTTPCDIFQTELVTDDTTTCPNVPLQLGASGGINYDWLPQTGLSCYDCPNPVFMGDSSIVYTVRIWSTDSCSKVLPVKVKVFPQPEFTSINLTPSACGEETGAIAGTSTSLSLPLSYALNGGAAQQSGTFTNLPTGTYTITVTDNNGCSADSTVFIDEEILVHASFTLEPPTGSAPLWVQSNNTSSNATNYSWTWADENSTDTHPGFYLDTSGNYTVTLIAYNNYPECTDTFSVQVLVYDSLQISIPNVFTPNNDGNNDFFGITTNVPTSGTVVIFNRWGNSLVEKDFTTQPHVFAAFWDGQEVTEGVYFYTIKLQVADEEVEYSGFVTLVR